MTTTTHYSFSLPTIGGNSGTWGLLLNGNLTSLDTVLWDLSNNSLTTNSVTTDSGVFPGATSGTVTVSAPAIAGTTVFTLPGSNGTSGQVLKTDGSGVTSWLTLGTAAALNVGTSASNVVQLNGSAQLPAVDGSLLTNLPTPSSVPTGVIAMWGTSTPPTGWLEMKGQSTSGYDDLAAIYGATLPDMRGYFARGWDDGRGVDSGRALLSTQTDDLESHTHTASVTDPGHTHTYGRGTSAFGAAFGLGDYRLDGSSSFNMNSHTTGVTVSNSSTGGTETRPINIALMFIVKT